MGSELDDARRADPGQATPFDPDRLAPGEEALLDAFDHPEACSPPFEVRGAFLSALLRNGGEPWRGPLPARLRLSGLKIAGPVRIDAGPEERQLHFDGCDFGAGLIGDGAVLDTLDLTDCRLAAASLRGARLRRLRLERVALGGHLVLDDLSACLLSLNASRLRGMLSLASARIERDLIVTASRIGTGKKALQADHIAVGRTIRLGAAEDEECRLEGAVSLVAARFDALLLGAALDGPLDLRRAAGEAVVAEAGASLGPVLLDRAVLGDLNIAEGACVRGPLQGANVAIAGHLKSSGHHLCAGAPAAIDLAGARIAGDLRLGDAFVADAPIRLHGGSIGGDIVLRGQVAVAAGDGLDMRGLKCGRLETGFTDFAGGISIRHTGCSGLALTGRYRCPADYPLHLGASCSGRIAIGSSAAPTDIAGTLSLIGASCDELALRRLAIVAPAEGRWAGVALAARHLDVATLTRFGLAQDGAAGLRLSGHVALDHARFGDDLRWCGVEVAAAPASAAAGGEASVALSMLNACVKGDIDFRDGANGAPVLLTGRILLEGLRVEGDLDLAGLRLAAPEGGSASALSLRSASIGGTLRVTGLGLVGEAHFDLGDAEAGRIEDRHGVAWSDARLEIARFRYGGIGDLADVTGCPHRDGIDARLAWIARHETGRFSPHPYRTLAAALRAAGHADDVGRVEMAARVQRRRNGAGPRVVRLGNLLLEWTSGYGYSPVRAAATFALVLLLGWAGTALAEAASAFEPSPFMDYHLLATSTSLPRGTCPWLDPPLYALDLLVPLVDLGHDDLCSIKADRPAWKFAATVYRLLGWVVMSLTLLTFAGILRKEV